MILQIPRMTPTGTRLQGRWYEKSKDASAQDQDQEQGITEHGMVYFKQDGETQVKEEPVDFPKAKSEIESLNHGEYNHYIGFINQKTHELLQFARYEPDGWYADVPIGARRKDWAGYVLGVQDEYGVGRLYLQAVHRRAALVRYAPVHDAARQPKFVM